MQFDHDLNSSFAALFLRVRDSVLSFEGMREIQNAKQTSYACEGRVQCMMRVRHGALVLAFNWGARLSEHYPQLIGDAKVVRHLYLYDEKDFDEALFRELIGKSIIYTIEQRELRRKPSP